MNKYGVQGDGGGQPGGFHLTVEGGGADPTKYKAENPEYIKADALLAAIGSVTKGRDLPDFSMDGLPDFINAVVSTEQQRQSMNNENSVKPEPITIQLPTKKGKWTGNVRTVKETSTKKSTKDQDPDTIFVQPYSTPKK